MCSSRGELYYRQFHCSMKVGYKRNHVYTFLLEGLLTCHFEDSIFLIHNQNMRITHHLTRTSSQAPAIPIPIPVTMITSHITDASTKGIITPLRPLCDFNPRSLSLSAPSSLIQSIVSPSTYVGGRLSGLGLCVPLLRSSPSSVRSYASSSWYSWSVRFGGYVSAQLPVRSLR